MVSPRRWQVNGPWRMSSVLAGGGLLGNGTGEAATAENRLMSRSRTLGLNLHQNLLVAGANGPLAPQL